VLGPFVLGPFTMGLFVKGINSAGPLCNVCEPLRGMGGNLFE
jgi:hypothetical protein